MWRRPTPPVTTRSSHEGYAPAANAQQPAAALRSCQTLGNAETVLEAGVPAALLPTRRASAIEHFDGRGSALWNQGGKEEALLKMMYQDRRTAALRDGLLHGVNSLAAVQTDNSSSLRGALLALCLIFASYLLVAALVLQPFEGWSHADSAYFAVVTFTTIGYGDITPKTDAGKVISLILAIGGLLTVTAALNYTGTIMAKENKRQELEEQLRHLEAETSAAAETAESLSRKTGPTATAKVPPASRPWVQSAWWVFSAIRPLLASITCMTLLGIICEGWNLLDSVYFALISILTVGYGDYAPKSRVGRTLCTFFLPIACAAALGSIAALSSALVQMTIAKSAARENDLDEQIARMRRMVEFGAGDAGLVSEADFICITLVELGLVDNAALGKVREQFYHFDKLAVGYLSIDSYKELLQLKQGGHKRKWHLALSSLVRQRRVSDVLGALMVAGPEARAERAARIASAESDEPAAITNDLRASQRRHSEPELPGAGHPSQLQML